MTHEREQAARFLTSHQQSCHQALKTSTYEQFKNDNPSRMKGTCEWVLKSSQYLNWWNSSCNNLLWISADPGCGKSVLAKSLIDIDFQTCDPNLPMCYFFFKDNDEQNSLSTALCAILHQLFTQQPNLIDHALPFWRKNGLKIQQEVDELWRLFITATSDPALNGVVCVFDALDECCENDQARLMQKLQAFHQQACSPSASQKSWLKFLITSRPYNHIQEHFSSHDRFLS